jgi:hypothetical protein
MRSRYLDDPDVLRRFWNKVDKSDVNGCWVWTGAIKDDGYGGFMVRGGFKRAHRLALEFELGDLPRNRLALHKCNNRRCVRVHPEHVYVGTYADNVSDAKTNDSYFNNRRRFTRAEIEDIRQRYAAGGVFQRQLAVEYGVNQSSISEIIRGITWNF